MATILSQKEIDELLNTPASTDAEEPADFGKDTSQKQSKTHFIKPIITSNSITVPYFSPVLKNNNIVYNPDNNQDFEENGKKAVWSISQYSKLFHK